MANENIKDFTPKEEATNEEEISLGAQVAGQVKQEKWLVSKWKSLKLWQKIMVIFILTGTVAGGVTVIYRLIKSKPEVVAEAIEQVENAGEVQPIKVVVPMDMNNATDAAVQDLVNELAKAQ